MHHTIHMHTTHALQTQHASHTSYASQTPHRDHIHTTGLFKKLSYRSRHGPIRWAGGPHGRRNGVYYAIVTPRHRRMAPHVRWRWFDAGVGRGRRSRHPGESTKYHCCQQWHCYSTREHTVTTHASRRGLKKRTAPGVKIWRKKLPCARARHRAYGWCDKYAETYCTRLQHWNQESTSF